VVYGKLLDYLEFTLQAMVNEISASITDAAYIVWLLYNKWIQPDDGRYRGQNM